VNAPPPTDPHGDVDGGRRQSPLVDVNNRDTWTAATGTLLRQNFISATRAAQRTKMTQRLPVAFLEQKKIEDYES